MITRISSDIGAFLCSKIFLCNHSLRSQCKIPVKGGLGHLQFRLQAGCNGLLLQDIKPTMIPVDFGKYEFQPRCTDSKHFKLFIFTGTGIHNLVPRVLSYSASWERGCEIQTLGTPAFVAICETV